MRARLFFVGFALSIGFAVSAAAQVQSAGRPAALCASLLDEFDSEGRRIAFFGIDVGGAAGAELEAHRQAERLAALANRQLVLSMLIANKCALPGYVPSLNEFPAETGRCRDALRRADAASADCRPQGWKRR